MYVGEIGQKFVNSEFKEGYLKKEVRDVYRYKTPTADGTPECLVQITVTCNFSNCAGGRVQGMVTHA